ncbi:MAG: CapA family protein [Crocinitomicaceae bacterium]|nr:CapA family protein [Crocinitomicaceae bacterium]MBK8927853.1 CapA family protein [Crocinitomicaceae bacterium]
MKTIFSLLLVIAVYSLSYSQSNPDTTSGKVSLLFIGDVMGHGPQITSALDKNSNTYDYNHCFKYIQDEMRDADYTIANLEVTLAGPPYSGYPQFSSPDELAVGCKNAGVDIFVTANNHSCDRGGQGIVRTLDVLDSLQILHTGTYRDSVERKTTTPFIIEHDCFRFAILNYTYGTNGINVPAPTIVNLLDKEQIAKDMEIAKTRKADKIIVVTHWGNEYESNAGTWQINMGKYLFEQGADIIIGSHPHVLQKMVLEKQTDAKGQEKLIVYSLGNFVSNQRDRKKDGGAMIKLTLTKESGTTFISEAGHILTWVYTPIENGSKKYYILPAAKYENKPEFFDGETSYNQMKLFISDSRSLFKEQNLNVGEYVYENEKWVLKY